MAFDWRGFMTLALAKAKAQVAEENCEEVRMFDDIDIQLQTVDLEEMSPKYTTCSHCGSTYAKNSTCMPCAQTFYFVHDCITMTIKLYNRDWTKAEKVVDLPN